MGNNGRSNGAGRGYHLDTEVAYGNAQPWPDAVKYLREFSFHGVQFCSFRKFPGPARPPDLSMTWQKFPDRKVLVWPRQPWLFSPP